MTNCQKYETLLIDKLFGDIDTRQEKQLEAHLASCPACRAMLAEFREVRESLGKPQRPDVPAHFWEGYWERLIKRMDHEPPPSPSLWERLLSFMPARGTPILQIASAAAVLVLGIFIGRTFFQDSPQVTATDATPPDAAEVQQVAARSEQLLERSKILLIGIVNEDLSAASAQDLKHQQQTSRTLLTEARDLRATLQQSPDRRLVQLLDQLEVVLLQIANLEAAHDLASIELVRNGINREGLLLKINLEELARQSQAPPAPRDHQKKML
ncbi:hypothetical protein EDS67_16355 [candidate division KSB1 bacterium]|nr:MAG: hypothetical protein EDS67_16355 [candidate division KSB1 bacterium]MBC6952132.1 hypothetical protein [candidate division KSB1 bacterium]MCE7942888.1 hypothetical protein [Chlorobi bacterium CHB1]MDL1873694.1 hypothetical protein [Cytophagia bacterium CHB2]